MVSIGTNYRHTIIVKTPIFWSFSKLEFYLLYYYTRLQSEMYHLIEDIIIVQGTQSRPGTQTGITIGSSADKSEQFLNGKQPHSDNIGHIINDAAACLDDDKKQCRV